MLRQAKHVLIVFLALILAISPAATALAQTSEWEARINLISTLERTDSMLLKVYFNLSEGSSPVLNADITGAQVTLLNTNYVSAGEVKRPDVPIYVTLVMDSSGSMGGAAEKLKEAAKLALSNTPDDSLFAITQFDEEIKLLQDFTDNISALTYAVDQYKVSNRGTCLYDAAYTAIETMAKGPAGRRAVILFTDGKDETRSGTVCSKHTYQQLVDFAMKSQVPIHTIGLSDKDSKINSVELQAMAASTGGFSAIASQTDLPSAFERIMQALKSQWMVEATVYPREGQNNAVLTLNVKDKPSLNTAFSFESTTEYPGPPSPVSVNFAGLQLKAAEQAYEVQLSMTSPELASYVKISVWDTDSGSKAAEYVFENPADFNSFIIPTEALIIGKDYELRIIVVSKADNTPFPLVRDDQGKTSNELIHPFKFDPSAAYPTVQIQSVSSQDGDIALNVSVTNPDLIGGFDGWLVDEDSNTQVANSNFTSPAINTSNGVITVPAKSSGVPDGKYTVILRVLAKNNNVYSTATYNGIAYKAPTLFERLGVALIAAPIFLVGIFVIILGVVGFMMWSSSRQKNLSGTPVMQGQLGGKLKGGGVKAGGPVIPIADDEPIPSRMPTPAPPPPPPASRQPAAPPPVSMPAYPVNTPSQGMADATLVPGGMDSADGKTMIAGMPAMPRARLTTIQAPPGLAPAAPVPLSTFPFVIGRGEGALVIQEPNISRKHAQITFDSARMAFYITDLNSSNGTRINGQRIPPGTPTPLPGGAMIGLGPNVALKFEVS